jgi:hypothetical protein
MHSSFDQTARWKNEGAPNKLLHATALRNAAREKWR